MEIIKQNRDKNMSEVWRILYFSGSPKNAFEKAFDRSDCAADYKAYGLAGYPKQCFTYGRAEARTHFDG